MKFRSTAILAVVFALLCAAYWGKDQLADRSVRIELEAKRVFQFDGEDVVYLEIEQLGEDPSAAERVDAETWKFVKPNDTITPLHILWSRVAAHISVMMNERTLDNAFDDLSQYGLDVPALIVRARTGSGREIDLRFGYMEPSQNYRYAQLDGGDIFLVKKNTFFELDRSRDLLRHRFLVVDRESPILRFEYAIIWRGDTNLNVEGDPVVGEELVPVVLERGSAEEEWAMTSPFNAPANQERVNELVAEVQFGVAEEFIDDPAPLEDYGLNPPAYRIAVYDAAGNGPQTLHIGDLDEIGESKGLFTKWEGSTSVFRIDPHILTLFPRTPSAFRERRLLSRKISALARIEYQDETSTFSLVQDENKGWVMWGDNVPPDTNQVAVSNYIALLKNVQAHAFQEGTPENWGLDKPEANLTLHYLDGAPPQVIALKRFEQEANYYLATQDSGQVVLIFDRDAEALIVSPDNFRSRRLLSFNANHVTQVAFTHQGAEFIAQKLHGKWLLKQPESYTISNQSDIPMLLDAINPLMGDPEPGEMGDANLFGFDPPVFSITLTLEDPAVEGAQQIGPVMIGYPTSLEAPQRFVIVPDRPGLFRVNNEVLEGIRTALQGIQPR